MIKPKTFLLLVMLVSSSAVRGQLFYQLNDLPLDTIEAILGEPIDSIRVRAERGGDGDAETSYGMYYLLSMNHNYQIAKRWLLKGEDNESIEATYWLGYMYHFGLGVSRDDDMAVRYWHKSANEGHLMSMYGIALYYYTGDESEKNADSTLYWTRLAADGGLAQAMTMMSILYSTGYGVSVDDDEALRWAYRASREDEPLAHLLLGNMLREGKVCKQDLKGARELLEKAKEELAGLTEELDETIDTELAALEEMERIDARVSKYGYTYAEYKKMTDDQFRSLIEKMANDGDAEAQYFLASMYYGGHHGMRKNYKLARYWYHQAANNGHENAKRALKELGW